MFMGNFYCMFCLELDVQQPGAVKDTVLCDLHLNPRYAHGQLAVLYLGHGSDVGDAEYETVISIWLLSCLSESGLKMTSERIAL